ncbi:MAG: replication initiation protein [Lachnospiraceae bacterium]|nr:replication initiation protein [Lachnospiraceae bacterium]
MNNSLAIKAENEDFLYSNLEVKKSNYLISAKYSSSLLEVQLLTLGVQRAERTDDGRISASFSARELRCLLGKQYKDVYSQLKKTAIKLLDNKIVIEDADSKKFAAVNIVSACRSENGCFSISFTKESEDIVFALKGGFTPMNVKLLTSFDSVLSFRLYEILKSKTWEFYKIADNLYSIDIGLSELRVTLGCLNIANPEIAALMSGSEKIDFDRVIEKGFAIAAKDKAFNKPKWNEYREFRRGVLEVAIPEINEKSDIEVNYAPIRQGRGAKVIGITFTIQRKKDKAKSKVVEFPRDISEDDVLDEIIAMRGGKLKVSEARSIAEAAKYDIEKIREKNEISKQSSYDNWTAFMIAAIKKDYTRNTTKSSAGARIHDFAERDIDYDELERFVNSDK